MSLLDMFGVPAEIGTPILYFRGTANKGYAPKLGYIQGIDNRILIKDVFGRDTKMYTPMFVVPDGLTKESHGEQIGHDFWGTPLCIGDKIITNSSFLFYKSATSRWSDGYAQRNVLVEATITAFDRSNTRSIKADISALYRLTRDSNTTPLYLRRYDKEKLFVSQEETPEWEAGKLNSGYGSFQDSTKGFYSCSKVVALKYSPTLRNTLLKAKLNAKSP